MRAGLVSQLLSLSTSQLPVCVHPWELDPEQPRVQEASANFKFRHYINLNKTETRLRSLIGSFDYSRFAACQQYLSV